MNDKNVTKPEVFWFRQDHEHRNYWLRFGFMRLHNSGSITYAERPWNQRVEFGFSENITSEPQKGVSLISIVRDGTRKKCIVESNDSCFVMSNQIVDADAYFCAGYNTSLFRDRIPPAPLAWQQSHEFERYQEQAKTLISEFGDCFGQVKPFVPIAPNLHRQSPLSYWQQKQRNLRHRFSKRNKSTIDWRSNLDDFENRYSYLISLRGLEQSHDIVLLDTLWGWPEHRLRLHHQLANLKNDGMDIRSRLTWHEPSTWDGSLHAPVDPKDFPIELGPKVGNYERELAKSRLAVFATGFHYGWRNIMTLALMIGIPVMSDRIILEPWFGMQKFTVYWNDHAEWNTIKPTLESIDRDIRKKIRDRNTNSFDEYLSPEKTAEYVIQAAFNDDKPTV